MTKTIYFDYAATTPVDPHVADSMYHYLLADGVFANPSSIHISGKAAKAAVEKARLQVASYLQAAPAEIIWTSGATEANNLAIKGSAALYQRKGKHIVTIKTEHASVLDSCQQLEKAGFTVTYLTPDNQGRITLDTLEKALRDDTILVSMMLVNNETGCLQDLAAIAALTSKRGILLHTDAAQAIGKTRLNVSEIPVDLISLCAHKVYGPKGIGALYIRKKPRVKVATQIHGGGQEQGMRSGTLPTHQIVGMGEAFALAERSYQTELVTMTELNRYLRERFALHPMIQVHAYANAVPHIINVSFADYTAKQLMQILPQLAISSGSACHAKGEEPSYVLRAMGFSHALAAATVRFSLGRFTTKSDIDDALTLIQQTLWR